MSFWKMTWAVCLGNILTAVVIYGTVLLAIVATVGVVGIKGLH